jgi:hypothetical protein
MAKFDIDAEPLSGVAIITTTKTLTTLCLSSEQIDSWVLELKQELDQAADKAKTAILCLQTLPDFPEGQN